MKTPRERAEELARKFCKLKQFEPPTGDVFDLADTLTPLLEEIEAARKLAESHSHLMRFGKMCGLMIADEKWELQKAYDAIRKKNSENGL